MVSNKIDKKNKGWVYRFGLGFYKPMILCQSVGWAMGEFNQVLPKLRGWISPTSFPSESALFLADINWQPDLFLFDAIQSWNVKRKYWSKFIRDYFAIFWEFNYRQIL